MEISSHVTIVLLLLLCGFTQNALGTGSLYDPPSRPVMWKYGYPTQKNYNYMQLNCGGEKQPEDGPKQCGVCGDYVNGTRDHELGGAYGTGLIGRYYPAGIKEFQVKVELLAFEEGFFEFRLCPANDQPVTQACLDEYLLPIKEGFHTGTPFRFLPEAAGDYRLTIAVPPNLTCDRCVLQWRYHTANSWGTDEATGAHAKGNGPQTEFYNCADVRIGGVIPDSVLANPFFAPLDSSPQVKIKTTDVNTAAIGSNVKPTAVDHMNPNTLDLLINAANSGGSLPINNAIGLNDISANTDWRMVTRGPGKGSASSSVVRTSLIDQSNMIPPLDSIPALSEAAGEANKQSNVPFITTGSSSGMNVHASGHSMETIQTDTSQIMNTITKTDIGNSVKSSSSFMTSSNDPTLLADQNQMASINVDTAGIHAANTVDQAIKLGQQEPSGSVGAMDLTNTFDTGKTTGDGIGSAGTFDVMGGSHMKSADQSMGGHVITSGSDQTFPSASNVGGATSADQRSMTISNVDGATGVDGAFISTSGGETIVHNKAVVSANDGAVTGMGPAMLPNTASDTAFVSIPPPDVGTGVDKTFVSFVDGGIGTAMDQGFVPSIGESTFGMDQTLSNSGTVSDKAFITIPAVDVGTGVDKTIGGAFTGTGQDFLSSGGAATASMNREIISSSVGVDTGMNQGPSGAKTTFITLPTGDMGTGMDTTFSLSDTGVSAGMDTGFQSSNIDTSTGMEQGFVSTVGNSATSSGSAIQSGTDTAFVSIPPVNAGNGFDQGFLSSSEMTGKGLGEMFPSDQTFLSTTNEATSGTNQASGNFGKTSETASLTIPSVDAGTRIDKAVVLPNEATATSMDQGQVSAGTDQTAFLSLPAVEPVTGVDQTFELSRGSGAVNGLDQTLVSTADSMVSSNDQAFVSSNTVPLIANDQGLVSSSGGLDQAFVPLIDGVAASEPNQNFISSNKNVPTGMDQAFASSSGAVDQTFISTSGETLTDTAFASIPAVDPVTGLDQTFTSFNGGVAGGIDQGFTSTFDGGASIQSQSFVTSGGESKSVMDQASIPVSGDPVTTGAETAFISVSSVDTGAGQSFSPSLSNMNINGQAVVNENVGLSSNQNNVKPNEMASMNIMVNEPFDVNSANRVDRLPMLIPPLKQTIQTRTPTDLGGQDISFVGDQTELTNTQDMTGTLATGQNAGFDSSLSTSSETRPKQVIIAPFARTKANVNEISTNQIDQQSGQIELSNTQDATGTLVTANQNSFFESSLGATNEAQPEQVIIEPFVTVKGSSVIAANDLGTIQLETQNIPVDTQTKSNLGSQGVQTFVTSLTSGQGEAMPVDRGMDQNTATLDMQVPALMPNMQIDSQATSILTGSQMDQGVGAFDIQLPGQIPNIEAGSELSASGTQFGQTVVGSSIQTQDTMPTFEVRDQAGAISTNMVQKIRPITEVARQGDVALSGIQMDQNFGVLDTQVPGSLSNFDVVGQAKTIFTNTQTDQNMGSFDMRAPEIMPNIEVGNQINTFTTGTQMDQGTTGTQMNQDTRGLNMLLSESVARVDVGGPSLVGGETIPELQSNNVDIGNVPGVGTRDQTITGPGISDVVSDMASSSTGIQDTSFISFDPFNLPSAPEFGVNSEPISNQLEPKGALTNDLSSTGITSATDTRMDSIIIPPVDETLPVVPGTNIGMFMEPTSSLQASNIVVDQIMEQTSLPKASTVVVGQEMESTSSLKASNVVVNQPSVDVQDANQVVDQSNTQGTRDRTLINFNPLPGASVTIESSRTKETTPTGSITLMDVRQPTNALRIPNGNTQSDGTITSMNTSITTNTRPVGAVTVLDRAKQVTSTRTGRMNDVTSTNEIGGRTFINFNQQRGTSTSVDTSMAGNGFPSGTVTVVDVRQGQDSNQQLDAFDATMNNDVRSSGSATMVNVKTNLPGQSVVSNQLNNVNENVVLSNNIVSSDPGVNTVDSTGDIRTFMNDVRATKEQMNRKFQAKSMAENRRNSANDRPINIKNEINNFDMNNIPNDSALGTNIQVDASGVLRPRFGQRNDETTRFRNQNRSFDTTNIRTRTSISTGDSSTQDTRGPATSSGRVMRVVIDPRTGAESRIWDSISDGSVRAIDLRSPQGTSRSNELSSTRSGSGSSGRSGFIEGRARDSARRTSIRDTQASRDSQPMRSREISPRERFRDVSRTRFEGSERTRFLPGERPIRRGDDRPMRRGDDRPIRRGDDRPMRRGDFPPGPTPRDRRPVPTGPFGTPFGPERRFRGDGGRRDRTRGGPIVPGDGFFPTPRGPVGGALGFGTLTPFRGASVRGFPGGLTFDGGRGGFGFGRGFPLFEGGAFPGASPILAPSLGTAPFEPFMGGTLTPAGFSGF